MLLFREQVSQCTVLTCGVVLQWLQVSQSLEFFVISGKVSLRVGLGVWEFVFQGVTVGLKAFHGRWGHETVGGVFVRGEIASEYCSLYVGQPCLYYFVLSESKNSGCRLLRT